ncbi:MAG: hypothetical protein RIS45_546 [Planctomycetota bacterium]|jgi:hypothetical protein
MAEPISAGGPAFPCDAIQFLRAYIAAKVLPWCLTEFGGNAEDMKQPAEAACQIADALIAELEGKESTDG